MNTIHITEIRGKKSYNIIGKNGIKKRKKERKRQQKINKLEKKSHYKTLLTFFFSISNSLQRGGKRREKKNSKYDKKKSAEGERLTFEGEGKMDGGREEGSGETRRKKKDGKN